MSKKGTLIHGYKVALQEQTHFGESKHQAKLKAREACQKSGETYTTIHGIYATSTLKDYDEICRRYVEWIMSNHRKEVKTYADCQKFAAEWLKEKELAGLSAWSLNLYGSALASSFGGISKHAFGYTYPSRERRNIVRNRIDILRGYDCTKRQRDAYTMLKATGCRRSEILRLRKEDFRPQIKDGKETGCLEVYKRGKGGIERWCLVNPLYTDFVKDFLKNASTYTHAGEKRLFEKNDVPKEGIHSVRSIYACDLYKYFLENGYASGKIYHCRKELVGYQYDKGILSEVSYHLQHSRDNIVVTYLWLMREQQ